MRTWRRAPIDLFCGRCGETVRRGSPVQEIRLIGTLRNRRTGEVGPDIDVTDRKVRCEKCADGRAPADLPALPVPLELTPIAKPVGRSSMTKLGKVAIDWKARQAGA